MNLFETVSLVFAIISTILCIVLSMWTLHQKKRNERALHIIKKENEELNYYLKSETPYIIQERYLKNINHYNNTNFKYDELDRLLYEIKKLRKDMYNSNETKIQRLTENINENSQKDFNYNELILQLSQMTNIQYLFDLLNSQNNEQYKYVKNVLSDIVHTIRNPASGMRAVIEILKLDNKNNIELLDKINDIENYINEIENNLNAYFQISNLSPSVVDENQTILLRDELDVRGKLLTISLGKKVKLDNNIENVSLNKNVAEILILAITCIWENSINFSKDNGIVYTHAYLYDNILTVEIFNEGPIIKKDLLENIFEKGFSTRGSSGRGLAIVKQAVEKTLNGTVICENIDDDYGVKFTIKIEVEKTNEQDITD